jgi:small subunit ribosomal protein S16
MVAMLTIRLKRVGRKHDPSYRVIVTDSHQGPKSGKYVEMVGSYDPRKNTRQIKAERVSFWISKGAQTSDTVHNILVGEGIVKGKKKNVLPRKTPIVKEASTKQEVTETLTTSEAGDIATTAEKEDATSEKQEGAAMSEEGKTP